MQTAIFSKIIGQILRHFFTIAAGYLIFVGVDKESNSELVDTTINLIVPLIILAAVQIYGVMQKRTQDYMFKYALHAPVGTTEEEVKQMVAKREPPKIEA